LLIIHVLLEIFYIQLGGFFLGLNICETIQPYSIFSSKILGKLGWSYHTKVRSKPYVKTQPWMQYKVCWDQKTKKFKLEIASKMFILFFSPFKVVYSFQKT
jgi:hypothetical protein